jgi:LemA protein
MMKTALSARGVRKLFLALTSLILVALAVPGCARYDELVQKDQSAAEMWSNLDAALQRRFDLVPNLVSTVKAAATHEETTLSQITEARARVGQLKLSADDLTDPAKMAAFQKAQSELTGSLSRLMVIQEQYPDLKANTAFRDLMVQLEGTENRILRAREEYNAAARAYNTELLQIGGQVVNKVTGKPFKERVYFAAGAEVQVAPKVSF